MTPFAADVAALVFKTGWYPRHHGGLGIIRTLGRAGVPVFGVHEHRDAPAARSSYLSGGFVWPTGSDDDPVDGWVSGLTHIADTIARPFVVIPTDDHAAIFLNDYADRLPDALRQPALAAGGARQLVDKKRCQDLVALAGVPVPATTVVRCPTTVSALGIRDYPVVVKRVDRALLGDGERTYSSLVVHDAEELRRLVEPPSEPHDVLLQEVVPGDDWLFIAYCDAGSDSLVSFTGRKLRAYPPGAGETAYGITEDNPALREMLEHLLKTIHFVGIASIDVRYDRRDGTYRLLDFNPRTGAAFRLFENVHGIDVIRALHLDLSGRSVPRGPQRDGRRYIVEPYDFWTGLRHLLGADERAWLARDDLRPVAAYLRGGGRQPVSSRHAVPAFFEGPNRARV